MGEGRRRRQPGEDGVRESLRCLRHVDLPLAGKGGAVSAGATYIQIHVCRSTCSKIYM